MNKPMGDPYAAWAGAEKRLQNAVDTIIDLRAEIHALKEGTQCTWSQDGGYDQDGNWNTSCGETFVIIEDTPSKNDMKFCCYCGGKLIEKLYEPEPEEE